MLSFSFRRLIPMALWDASSFEYLPSGRRVPSALLPGNVRAEGIDTEHLFGFMIGTDIGNVGEREFQSQTTGRFARNGGSYRAIGQEFELEFVPVKNVRVELGTTFASHHISGVPGLEDRRRCPGRASP